MNEPRNRRRPWHIAVGSITLVHLLFSGFLSVGAIMLSNRGPIAGLFRIPGAIVGETVRDLNRLSGDDARKQRREAARRKREADRKWRAIAAYSWLAAVPLALIGGIGCIAGKRWSHPTLGITFGLWLTSAIAGWAAGGVGIASGILTAFPVMLTAFLAMASTELPRKTDQNALGEMSRIT